MDKANISFVMNRSVKTLLDTGRFHISQKEL